MEYSKNSKQFHKVFGNQTNYSWILIAVLLIFLFPTPEVFSQQQLDNEFQISFHTRTYTPQPGINTLLQDSLGAQLKRGEKRHIYLQLTKHLSDKERYDLEEQGIQLLSYVDSYTWYASLTNPRVLYFAIPDSVRHMSELNTMRWIGEIPFEDKVEAKITQEGVGSYNRNPDGTVNIIVLFFPDVSLEGVDSIINRYGEFLGEPGILNDVVVRIQESDIQYLAREDIVQWIEEVGSEDDIHNDGSRTRINVDPLQILPYNLDGTNVQVGVWDGGEIDDTHDDLRGRVTIVEAVGINNHATHVAGTLGGDGSRSLAEGGSVAQWRGMAPSVTYFSHSFIANDLEPEEHDSAINVYGIDISQNSWGRTANFGDYRSRSAKYDKIVAGLYGRAIPVVFSAGNSGSGFTTVNPPGGTAKNVIVVGNVLSDTDQLSNSSSRGPTDNSLIKPDVVAPGNQTPDGINNPPDIRSTIPANTYGEMAGTSMASPAVSGTIALMLQQYRNTFFDDDQSNEAPLPSTFKAILCHTAEDLVDNPSGIADLDGPDYVYGYGLIDAHAAVDAIRDNLFREGEIQSVDDVKIYKIYASSRDNELKVTLAWDDVAGSPGAADILQNDLDLMLINPTRDEYYPPWELDPDNPVSPAVRDSYTSTENAEDHRDNINVVEQVTVDNPNTGIWTVLVKASDLPFANQNFSIISDLIIVDSIKASFEYAAKIILGNQSVNSHTNILRGRYSTSVNIHNPGYSKNILFQKLVLTYPPGNHSEGEIIPIRYSILGPDKAFSIDFNTLQPLVSTNLSNDYVEGFVIIQSEQPLDVYTTYSASGFFRRANTLEIEKAECRILNPDKKLPDLTLVPYKNGSFYKEVVVGTNRDSLEFTVRNIGKESCGPFKVDLYRVHVNRVHVGFNYVQGLKKDEFVKLRMRAYPIFGIGGSYTFETIIDSLNEVMESNEQNNIISGKVH